MPSSALDAADQGEAAVGGVIAVVVVGVEPSRQGVGSFGLAVEGPEVDPFVGEGAVGASGSPVGLRPGPGVKIRRLLRNVVMAARQAWMLR